MIKIIKYFSVFLIVTVALISITITSLILSDCKNHRVEIINKNDYGIDFAITEYEEKILEGHIEKNRGILKDIKVKRSEVVTLHIMHGDLLYSAEGGYIDGASARKDVFTIKDNGIDRDSIDLYPTEGLSGIKLWFNEIVEVLYIGRIVLSCSTE